MSDQQRRSPRESFVEALSLYRQVSRGDDVVDDYWAALDRTATQFKEATPMAMRLLDADDNARRHVAWDLLALTAARYPGVRESVAVHALGFAEAEPVASIKVSAVVALGETRSRAIVPFVAALAGSDDNDMRWAAVKALATCQSADVLDLSTVRILFEALDDKDPEIRAWAASGVAMAPDVDDRRIRDALARRLFDADDRVRNTAIRGLAERSDERAVPAMTQALEAETIPPLVLDGVRAFPHRSFVHLLERHAAGTEGAGDLIEACRTAVR